jgi:hypothetical protein
MNKTSNENKASGRADSATAGRYLYSIQNRTVAIRFLSFLVYLAYVFNIFTDTIRTMDWMDNPDFGLTLPAALHPLHDNFRKMAALYKATANN